MQDVVLGICNFLLALSLVPTVRSSDKPPLATALGLCVLLAIMAVTFATLELWLSVVALSVQAGLWATIAVQIRRASTTDAGASRSAPRRDDGVGAS